jgi:hypothetical protein
MYPQARLLRTLQMGVVHPTPQGFLVGSRGM